jgi:hypothetical protein
VVELARVEWLGEKIPGTAFHGLDGGAEVSVRGDDHDREVRAHGEEAGDEIEATLLDQT